MAQNVSNSLILSEIRFSVLFIYNLSKMQQVLELFWGNINVFKIVLMFYIINLNKPV